MFGIESAFGMHFVGNKLAELKGLAELKALSRIVAFVYVGDGLRDALDPRLSA